MLVQRGGRIFYVLGVFKQPVPATVTIFSTIWLGKTVADCTANENHGRGLLCHDLRRSTSNYLANSGLLVFVCVDAFYLRKPGKIPYVLI